MLRIIAFIVQILVSIFIILPVIKRYIEHMKRVEIEKSKGQGIVVVQQEATPNVRKSYLGRLNPSDEVSRFDISPSYEIEEEAS